MITPADGSLEHRVVSRVEAGAVVVALRLTGNSAGDFVAAASRPVMEPTWERRTEATIGCVPIQMSRKINRVIPCAIERPRYRYIITS